MPRPTRQLVWPAPAPPPPLREDGTPVVADGRVIVQIAVAHGADLWDGARWGQGRWDAVNLENIEDMTCDVEGLSITRGRTDPLSPYTPGQLTMTLQDPDRRWSPAALDDSGFRRMRSKLPIRVVALAGEAPAHVVLPLFAGELESLEELDDGREPPMVALSAKGPTWRLRNDSVNPGTAGAGQTVKPRMQALLALSSLPGYWPTTLEDGSEAMQAFDVEPDDPSTGSVLEYLELLANSDGGALLEDRNGGLVYAKRATLEAARPPVNITDYPTGARDLCPVSITMTLDAERVINAVGVRRRDTATEPDPPTVWADHAASQVWAGRRSFQLDGLLHTTDSYGALLAGFLLERAATADFVVSPVVGEVLTTPRWLEVGAALELGDPLTIRRDDGHGTPVHATSYVDGLRHDIVRTTWTMQITPGGTVARTAYARWGKARWDQAAWP